MHAFSWTISMSVQSAQNMVYNWSFLSIAELEANSTSLSTFIALQFPDPGQV